ncbi:MAG: L-aspartate oxidase [Thermoplasmatota archaeon]
MFRDVRRVSASVDASAGSEAAREARALAVDVVDAVLVVGAGPAGRAAAEAAQRAGAPVILIDKSAPAVAPGPGAEPTRLRPGQAGSPVPIVPAFAVDLVVRKDDLAGVLLLAGESMVLLAPRACVLATGGIEGLFIDVPQTGDGFAMAARVGLPVEGAFGATIDIDAATGAGRVRQGLRVRGGATRVRGLYAAGAVTGDRGPEGATREGAWAGTQAAKGSRGAPVHPGPPPARPPIDSPLPPGFAAPKWAKLRETVRQGLMRPAEAVPVLLRLKGEADDFARSRWDTDLYALRNACEVALQVMRTRQGAGAGRGEARADRTGARR